MGRLSGHLLPGSLFLVFALWWLWAVLHRYFICKRESRLRSSTSYKKKRVTTSYRNSASFLCTSSCFNRGGLHIEAILKVFFTTVGIIGELATAFRDGKFVNLGNGQHISMYSFFLLNGIFDLLQHHGYVLIPDMDYISALLAIFIEAFLFANHLHGRPPLDVQIHTFLLYVLAATFIFGVCEMYHRKSVLPALGRTFCFLLQGTWFYQVGFMLYPPNGNTWDEESHDLMMIATMIFTAHCAGIFIFMALATIAIYFRVKFMDPSTMQDIIFPYISINATPGKVQHFKLESEESVNRISTDTEEEIL